MAFVARPDTSIRAMDGDLTQERHAEGLQAHFAEHSGSMRRMIAARLGSQDDADDLLQELWIRLADVHSGPVANPKAYLHKMALNLANDLVRERVRRRKRESSWSDHMIAEADTVAIDPSPSPERQLSDRMELAALLATIRSLPDKAQLVFRRHRIDGLSHGEVARELGISKSAVEKNMATAMKHLLRARREGEGI
ncbi:RNA polymerase sigma factor [Aquisediminimonas profunda]|uniref:RNA polymerase sigma factor n=1 Tax=Aquisediminimonas profunda TaxID=1550733 RepID=UPI001C625A7E|nr:sigma-70 family RNA polymerase sigma factor [Aquisediminimonas profunda]